MAGQLDAVEPGGELDQPAGGGRLAAGVEPRRAEPVAAVEDGHRGGPVADGHHVGVRGVHCQSEPHV